MIQTQRNFITFYLYMRSAIFSETVPYNIYIYIYCPDYSMERRCPQNSERSIFYFIFVFYFIYFIHSNFEILSDK